LPQSIAGNRLADNLPRYALDLLIGENGALAFFPILLWYLWGAWRTVRSTKATERHLALIVLAGTLLYFSYFLFSTDNFGGFAFSPRWLLLPVPLLAAFALRTGWPTGFAGQTAVIAIALFSIVSTYRGALDPWGPARPIFYTAVHIPEPRRYIPVSLSGYGSFEHINPDVRQSFGVNTTPRRWFDARGGLVVPSTEGWWFIHESTPLSPWLANALGLSSAPLTYGFNADLAPAAREWIAAMAKTAYRSEQLVPTEAVETEAISMPVTFTLDDDQIGLHGYELHHTEDTLWLITAWQIEQRVFPTGSRRIFLHLLDEDGQIVAQDDSFAADYESLLFGDYFFQVQRIDLANVANGRYWLQIGLYNPDRQTRLLTAAGDDRLLLPPWTK
jgi:hypothetical protein